MATLQVEATKSSGVTDYVLVIDRKPIAMAGNNKGSVVVSGSCGDGSKHQLLYSFEGAAGDTLSVTVTCAGSEVCKLKQARITAASEPYGAGSKGFTL